MKTCWKCGWEWQETRQPSSKETCPNCSSYLHVCKNCRLYDPRVHNGCTSSTTEWIPDKEAHNFCEEFQFADRRPEEVAGGGTERARMAREKFLQLFGEEQKKDSGKDKDNTQKLRKLFGP
ncbi:MAG: hypothetical protein HYU36_02220 [Planctomycetes bacterium]|nr:hypothetical protein [Planctomycetota bacterium]